jgi:hypothetical protein
VITSSSRNLKDPVGNHFPTQFPTVTRVHGENGDRGPATRSSSHDPRANQAKVAMPFLTPRVEQWHDVAFARINARKVGSLVMIAVMASQREVFEPVATTVLLGDDVFHMKAIIGFWCKRQYSQRSPALS